MTLVLQAHYSLQLLSHLHGRRLTLEKLLQAPPGNSPVRHAEQPVEDIPMPDTSNISNSEDTDSAHLPKIKQRPEWLKPIPEEDRPETLEPDWFVPPNDLPEPENNWQMHSLIPIKIQKKTSYFGRLVIWDHSVDKI
ncbi:hypothetical protein Tco_1077321 [Tanacetum coccineum]